jgi:hypothetical protein
MLPIAVQQRLPPQDAARIPKLRHSAVGRPPARATAQPPFIFAPAPNRPPAPAAAPRGNGHMLMMDTNSDQVAELIQKWMADRGLMR